MLQLYDEMKEIEKDSQYFEIWYGFHSFNLASNHIYILGRIGPGVANIAFQFPSFRHRVKA